ncbi:BnaAnng36870D [Brassica napus]|uniref:BnaAnng36870D protein n=1 Tax=Brassica napus TaxID=3708 RepID=A0A078JX67_BRANA|nr:BnaAnng36870D [Brassica napus]
MVDRRSALCFVSSFFFLSLLLFDGVAVAKPRTRFDELLTLLRLRSTLGLKGTDWPIKGDPCRVWRGIQCDRNGSIVGINISGFKRTRIGKQSPHFAVDPLLNLTRLAYFNASGFELPGSVPDWFGLSLTTLRVLDLSSCSVNGVVPVTLGNLTRLVSLNLSRNSLTGSVPSTDLFGAKSQLQSFVLRENGFSGNLPDAYWSLPKLRILDIAKNNFTGMLPNSSSGPNADVVDISSNMFYGELTQILTRFSAMYLSGNYFEGKVPDYVLRANASLTRNCLQNERRQKSSEDCSSFYKAKGLDFDDFGRPNSTQPTSKKASSTGLSRRTVIILASVGGGIGFILIFILLPILVALWMRRRGREGQGGGGDRPKPATEASQPPKGAQTFDLSRLGNAFTYDHLLQATGDFNDANLIKRGHSGSLFRGFLDNGTPIVIKKIDTKESKNEGYIAELELLSKAGHQRLVPCLGHCLENEGQKLLVYKFMRNGDLASALFRKSDNEGDGLKSLDWITRLKIALGAAEGLAYLHHECSPPLVHRDVQASSILLDDKFEVRLGSLSEAYVQGDAYQSRISRLLRLPQ